MASGDATPFPIKNQAYRVTFPILDADGDLVEGMAGLDSEVSKDGGTFANCTNEATEILTIVHDVNDTTNSITSANASDQTTLNTLLNEIKSDYNAHVASTTFHDSADSTNTVTSADASDLATSMTLANEIKTDYNAHRNQADVHPHDDSGNVVSSADGTDLATTITLANEIKTDYNAHLTGTVGSGMAYLDLTATEMNADTIAGVIKSTTTGAKTTPFVLYPAENTDIPVNVTAIGGVAQSATDLKDMVDTGYDPATHKIQSDLIYIHGTALTETNGQLAAAFKKLFDVATPLLVASDVMRGTDSAALASALATAQTDLDTITGTDGVTLATAQALYAPNKVVPDAAGTLATYDPPTNAEMEARTLLAADYLVESDTLAAVTTATNLTNAPTVGDLTAAMKTSVNTEVADVLKTDTTSEMSQGAPPATPTLEEMIAYLYFKLRNKGLTTATEDAMYDNAGTTKLMKSTLSDNGTTFTKEEYVSGA
ncbi:MAG: hypothetical protein U9Q68_03805 [Euryarchaeota archaeon]|nr:hypothetical protein [Euryarchaeota archaeon]